MELASGLVVRIWVLTVEGEACENRNLVASLSVESGETTACVQEPAVDTDEVILLVSGIRATARDD